MGIQETGIGKSWLFVHLQSGWGNRISCRIFPYAGKLPHKAVMLLEQSSWNDRPSAKNPFCGLQAQMFSFWQHVGNKLWHLNYSIQNEHCLIYSIGVSTNTVQKGIHSQLLESFYFVKHSWKRTSSDKIKKSLVSICGWRKRLPCGSREDLWLLILWSPFRSGRWTGCHPCCRR